MKNVLRIMVTLLLTAVAVVLLPMVTVAEEAVTAVTDTVKMRITEEEGFLHPGLSIDPYQLEKTREELLKGNSEYQAYFDAMAATDAASKNFGSGNLKAGTLHEPAWTAYNAQWQNMTLSKDSFKAYTSAVMYYLTGEDCYRYNAIRLIRIWSNLNPDEFTYFNDAHIHMPVPMYYLIAAAEMVKYTDPINETYTDKEVTDYSLVWTTEDDRKLIDNMLDPAQKTFYYKKDYYMNQHLYAVTGMMANAIFKNDRDQYAEAVEMFTVNSASSHLERNGALINQYKLIEADHPENPIREDFIQHREMGRDNAHSSGDVLNMIGLARILHQQRTKVDPVTGEVSAASDATTIYSFLGNRLLAGTESWARYMVGHTVPWAKTGGGMDFGGDISVAYRGRTGLYYSSSELYDMYRYQEGMTADELAEKAPMLTHMAQNQAAPIFYNGTGKVNFWGAHSDNKMTEIGCEYWLSMPLERQSDSSLTVPATDDDCQLDFAVRGAIMDEEMAEIVTEDGKKFISTIAVSSREELKETDYDKRYPNDTKTLRGGTHFSIASMHKQPYQAIRYRSNGSAQLHLTSGNNQLPAHTILTLPDTGGKWKTLVYSTKEIVDNKALNLGNLDYYAVVSNKEGVKVDFDWLNYVNVGDGLKGMIPEFAADLGDARSLLKGQTLSVPIEVANGEGATLSLNEVQEGVDFEAGVVAIDSQFFTEGNHQIILTAENKDFVRGASINLIVYDNQQAAFDLAIGEFDPNAIYTSVSKNAFFKEKAAVEKLMADGCSDAEFMEAYDGLLKAARGLELLNPIFEDGSFDYAKYLSILPKNPYAFNLLDKDDSTHSGDLNRPYVFDFGKDYRMTAASFQLQTRRGFANRYKGFNVYGSDDNKNFILLTERPTNQVDEMETIAVKEELRDRPFRYFVLSCDEPGPPTDPAYPGISSFGEFRVYGERIEVANKVNKAEIINSNLKNLLLPGDELQLEIGAVEAISDLKVSIERIAADIKKIDDQNWVAKITYPAGKEELTEVPVIIDYKNAAGEQAPTLYETTNTNNFYKSDDTHLISDAHSRIYKTSNGNADWAKAWFDQDVTTMGEYGREGATPAVYARFDFTDGPIKLDRLEFLARQDEYAGRAAYYEVHASQDGQTWTNIATRGKNTQDWQAITVNKEFRDTEYNFIQIYCWANNIGLAELRIIGEQGEPTIINAVTDVYFETPTMKNLIKPGETLKLNIKSDRKIVDPKVKIMDIQADVVSEDGLNWVASIIFPGKIAAGTEVPFSVDYQDEDGRTGITIKQTTNGSTVFPTDDSRLIEGLFKRVYKTSNRSPKDTAAWFDDDYTTGSEFAKEANGQTYVQFDFSDNPVKLDRIEFITRQDEWASRASTYQLQVSQDGENWIDTGNWGRGIQDWQALTIGSNEKDAYYKYVRLYCWANYLCINEMRMIGELKTPSAVDLVDSVAIRTDGIKSMVIPGGKVSLDIVTKEAIQELSATIAGIDATVTTTDNINWQAEIEFPENQNLGWGVDFTVDYTAANGAPGLPVVRTTDGSNIFKSDKDMLVLDGADRVYATSNRTVEDAAAWFDNDVKTNSEFFKAANGESFVALDFTDSPIILDRIEFLARQDEWCRRARVYRIQASANGLDWEDVGKEWGKESQEWQTFEIKDEFKKTEFKYVRFYAWAEYLNAVELRIFGQQRELADKTELLTALEAAETKNQSDYTLDSWTVFAEAKATATSICDDEAATQESVNSATADLNKAMTDLVLFVKGESIVIDCKNSISIKAGQTLQVNGVVMPETATNQDLVFVSANEKIATVSPEGLIRGGKAGRTTVTVTNADGLKKTISVQIAK